MAALGGRRAATAVFVGLVVALAVPSASLAGESTTNEDEQLAASAVLQSSDFPSGWVAAPAASTEQSDEIREGIPACKRYQSALVTTRKQPRAVSPQFTQGNASVNMSVAVFPTKRSAQRVLKSVGKKDVARCLRKATKTALEQNVAQLGPETLTDVSAFRASETDVGDADVAYEVLTIVTQGTTSTTVYVALHVIRVGRALVVFSFRSVGDRFPALGNDLERAVIDRLRSPTDEAAAAEVKSAVGAPSPAA